MERMWRSEDVSCIDVAVRLLVNLLKFLSVDKKRDVMTVQLVPSVRNFYLITSPAVIPSSIQIPKVGTPLVICPSSQDRGLTYMFHLHN